MVVSRKSVCLPSACLAAALAACLSLCVSALTALPAAAADLFVNADGSGDYPTIQAAFDAAAPGDVIRLGPGTYRDSHTRTVTDFDGDLTTTTSVAFITPNVSIEGTSGADFTIIDGEGTHRCLTGVDLGDVQVRDITFLDGLANGTGSLIRKAAGGLVMEGASSALVEDCYFYRCAAPEVGIDGSGGLYFLNSSTAEARRNTFLECFGGDLGGAMGVYLVNFVLIENNTFVNNEAGDKGGALAVNASGGQVTANVFFGNTAANNGGAVGCFNGASFLGTCNLFWQNTAPQDPNTYRCSFAVGFQDNLEADPMFCDASAFDFGLMVGSPAAPGGNCGLRGALGVTCGPISVRETTWSQVKSLYR